MLAGEREEPPENANNAERWLCPFSSGNWEMERCTPRREIVQRV